MTMNCEACHVSIAGGCNTVDAAAPPNTDNGTAERYLLENQELRQQLQAAMNMVGT